MESKEFRRLIYIVGVISGIVLVLLMIIIFCNKVTPILEQIAIDETKKVYVDDWNCRDYSEYYNKTFTEKYPELDVRWIRQLDICNNNTYCKDYHTYILINGYGGECIIDQHQVACVQITSIENE